MLDNIDMLANETESALDEKLPDMDKFKNLLDMFLESIGRYSICREDWKTQRYDAVVKSQGWWEQQVLLWKGNGDLSERDGGLGKI